MNWMSMEKKLRQLRWIRSNNLFFYPERYGSDKGFTPKKALELEKEWKKTKVSRLLDARKS